MKNLHDNCDDLFKIIHEMVVAQSNGEMTREQFAVFDELLADSEKARQLYVEYIYESLALPLMLGLSENEHVLPSFANFEQEGSEPSAPPAATIASLDQHHRPGFDSTALSFFPSILSTTVHSTIGFFSQELPFSLLIAAVLTSLGLWFASMV